MKSTERVVGNFRVTEDDNEKLCPLMGGKPCMAEACAMALSSGSVSGTNWYCGLVATEDNTTWNEDYNARLDANWVKSVLREAI